MSSFDLSPDLAARLDALIPAEALASDWGDVVRRLDSPPARRLRPLKVALALCLLLLLAIVAWATYLAFRPSAPSPGALTVVAGAPYGGSTAHPARIVEIRRDGSTHVVWRCPNGGYCGELDGVDWASDGRHLAFTLAGWTMPAERLSALKPLGLHIVDLATGRDIHAPRLFQYSSLGCFDPGTVAWSGDSKMLAYDCSPGQGRAIAVIRADGTHPRPIHTGMFDASWPSWSPDGKRLAFAGIVVPRELPPRCCFSIYVMRLDGTRRVRVARSGDAPSWSPDGKTIAYDGPDGIRLVTPDGVDVTPDGGAIAPSGIPSWSVDGRTLAVAANDGVYLVGKTGAGLRRVTSLTGAAGPVRPAWYPAKAAPRSPQAAHQCGPC